MKTHLTPGLNNKTEFDPQLLSGKENKYYTLSITIIFLILINGEFFHGVLEDRRMEEKNRVIKC